ncbi:MAG: RagB/SusD family nutrient uptake outer membrane protein [Bacteroidales bacterium]|nr:RagB/SusD family nutrient uptake outer membrane protein [Bacteroidales bacterium]MBR5810237.1 RagB/SusD family nutrient uptake outer membrane protein [Bacteroidales bacterium]
MKKLFYILSVALLATGCNFLDFDESSSDYSRDDMYLTYSNIQKMLTNIYGYMPNKNIYDVSDALRDCGSDDAEYGDPDASVQRFTNGTWSALNTVDDKWSTMYSGIRSANEFLESIKTVDLSMYQYDTKYQRWLEHLKYYPYQAKVLRAYYFFELARRYGDIPMPLTMLTAEEANMIEKTPFDEVINFIVTECDEAAKNLPDTYVGLLDDETGRVTRGFALAVKTKALLYAASPLHNPSGDKSKWEKAAAAAKEIMELNVYRLDPDEKANNYTSQEVIFAIMRSESSSFELYNFPVRFTEGQRTYMSGTYPTQNLVDAFQTANGYDITLGSDGWQTSDPDFDITKPYEGRDPRFARAILADGMSFKGSTIETFVGGKDYSATRNDLGSPTGYYLRRYIQESTSFTPENSVSNKHQWIVYRYAEALLTYAEAMNEYLGSPTSTAGEFTVSALEALNMVRANAGMPDVTVTSQSDFREAVRREWRVEFAFEDHRFWDVRRWNIGQATQGQIDGVEITRSGGKSDYRRMTVETRTWSARQNLFPIPQSELFCNPNLNPQNTGW